MEMEVVTAVVEAGRRAGPKSAETQREKAASQEMETVSLIA